MTPKSRSEKDTISGRRIRRLVLEESKRAGVGHIGSSLCIADILAALYGQVLNIPSANAPDRDRFVLSKGHAALALYAALHLKGFISRETLATYCGDESLLGVHPEHRLPGVDFSTGSLGHGLPMAAGAALGARMQGGKRRVFSLLSDAELNEGSVWEAVMFAAHHRLSNLIAIIDENGQQALGYTKDVLCLEPISERFRAFGWNALDIDGHDVPEIVRTVNGLATDRGPPHVLVAHTVFGKGVSYMEGSIKWHYWPMSDEEYEQALREIGTT